MTDPKILSRLSFMLSLALSGSITIDAAERSPKKKLSPKLETEIAVETLTQRAKESVVVISHFDRTGREDGIGAGFVIASNGLIATSLHVIGEGGPLKCSSRMAAVTMLTKSMLGIENLISQSSEWP